MKKIRYVIVFAFMLSVVMGGYTYRSRLNAIADRILPPRSDFTKVLGVESPDPPRPVEEDTASAIGPVVSASGFEKRTSFPPLSMLRHVQRRLIRVFLRSINAPTTLSRGTRPIRGFKADLNLEATLESNPLFPGDQFRVRTRVEGYADGDGRARVEVDRPPDRFSGPLRIELRGRTIQVLTPETGSSYRRVLPKTTTGVLDALGGLFWMGEDRTVRLRSIRPVTVAKWEAYRIRVHEPESERSWAFEITRDPMYRLLTAASQGSGGGLRIHYRYRPTTGGEYLREIRVFTPWFDAPMRMRFEHRDRRLRRLLATAPGTATGSGPTVSLRWVHGPRYSRGARILTGDSSNTEGARLSWEFQNGYPVRLGFRLVQNRRRLSLRTDSIRWLTEKRSLALSELSNRSRVSFKQLASRWLPERVREVSQKELVDSLPSTDGADSRPGTKGREESTPNNFDLDQPPDAYRFAQRAFRRGKNQKAVRHLETLLRNYPGSVHGNFMMGVLLFRMESYRRAVPYFQRTIRQRRNPQIQAWGREYLARLERRLDSVN